MKNFLTFDDSLSVFVTALSSVLTPEVIGTGWMLRDVSGRLSFISRKALSPDDQALATRTVQEAVSKYCRQSYCILNAESPGVDTLLTSPHITEEIVPIHSDDANERTIVKSIKIKFIDHRIVGADWLNQPALGWQPPAPARIVFASLKGGVGRSTALTVVATDLAREGNKVLAIDLDLEAPGIGTMLIDENDKPKYGVLDWYVERGIGTIDDDRDFLLDMIAPSPFGGGNGLIDVVPATGFTSDKHAANVLAKLARAYLEVPSEEGAPVTFLGQTQILINQLSSLKQYDAILIDARAGLNESTAAAVLGLGADVLLFGVDTPQTFASYRYLLSHLSRFPRAQEDDWLYRLRMVHAKASPDVKAHSAFRDRAFEIFSEFLYRDTPLIDEVAFVNNSGEKVQFVNDNIEKVSFTIREFGLEDPTGPHYAWRVLADSNYSEFSPLSNVSQLAEDFYRRSYSSLLDEVKMLIVAAGDVS